MFIQQLYTALHRASIIKKLTYQSNIKAKESSTVPLGSDKKWKEWESKFINYFPKLIEVNGSPLSCVLWENDNPDANGDFPHFIYNTILCAP